MQKRAENSPPSNGTFKSRVKAVSSETAKSSSMGAPPQERLSSAASTFSSAATCACGIINMRKIRESCETKSKAVIINACSEPMKRQKITRQLWSP